MPSRVFLFFRLHRLHLAIKVAWAHNASAPTYPSLRPKPCSKDGFWLHYLATMPNGRLRQTKKLKRYQNPNMCFQTNNGINGVPTNRTWIDIINTPLCSLATIVCTVAQLRFHFACHFPKGVAIPRVKKGSKYPPSVHLSSLGKISEQSPPSAEKYKTWAKRTAGHWSTWTIRDLFHDDSLFLAVFNFHARF